SPGLNEGGSWIQSVWARGPRGSIAARNARKVSPAAVPARRCSWVDGLGGVRVEREVWLVLLGPASALARGGWGVQGGVAVDGVAPGRIGAEAVVRGQRWRQVTPSPRLICPHRATDVESHGFEAICWRRPALRVRGPGRAAPGHRGGYGPGG